MNKVNYLILETGTIAKHAPILPTKCEYQAPIQGTG